VDLASWIADYETHLHSDGHAGATIVRRLKHLHCLQRFCAVKGLSRLEDFTPKIAEGFIDFWIEHQPWAKTSAGFKGKPTFRPRHHIGIQYSLHSFFRWAYSTGRFKLDLFPLRPVVRGHYFFPEVTEYLRFCEEHKGLAENSLLQIELFVRRFDHFLHEQQVTSWNELSVEQIDLFVFQQASRNVKRIQRVHKILRGLFRYLFSLGRVKKDWASALLSPRHYRLARTPRALASEQVLHLLRSIDRAAWGGKRDFAMILMAAGLGVRASEIAALRLQDLDWTQAAVSFPPIKGKNVLCMPLSRPLIEALADYLKTERPNGRSYRNVFLGLTPPFGPLRSRSLSCVIARRMRRAGIKGSGHQLRHAFASELLRGGIAFSNLQELLGHSHLSSTQIYTKIDMAQLREVAGNDAEDM
jgi:site-specific recombinase XerD